MTAPHIVTIVQARMGSTRLPGKVLADLAGRPMLERQLERLARATTHDSIVVATTVEKRDNPIADLAERLSYPVFRGSEDDVLARYVGAGRAYGAEIVVRVTADCPLIDPGVLDGCSTILTEDTSIDYASNTVERTYPRGLDVEVLRMETLEIANHEARDPADREHVTRFIWRQPDRFRLASLTAAHDHSQYRWTVDALEDLRLVRQIYSDLYRRRPDFTYKDILDHARAHPDWHLANRHVPQQS